jgi:hypothetical protein
MRRALIPVAISLLAAACSNGDGTVTPTSPIAPTPPTEASAPGRPDSILLTGSIRVPAAREFSDPGFHETFVLTGTVPEAAAGATGELVVRLRDVGRPNLTCDRDHPLSGCATVDWSDFEDRPGVPPGGVFDNHLSVVSSSGAIALFLSERRGLASAPDEYSPT